MRVGFQVIEVVILPALTRTLIEVASDGKGTLSYARRRRMNIAAQMMFLSYRPTR